MNVTEKDYQEWVRMANDPAQTEEIRISCREKMSDYLHEQLRQAFQQRSAQMSPELQSL